MCTLMLKVYTSKYYLCKYTLHMNCIPIPRITSKSYLKINIIQIAFLIELFNIFFFSSVRADLKYYKYLITFCEHVYYYNIKLTILN